jgi:hypothetical protein
LEDGAMKVSMAILVLFCTVRMADGATLEELIAKSLAVQAEVTGIENEMDDATAAEQVRLNELSGMLYQLKKPPMDDETIARYRQSIESYKRRIAEYEARLAMGQIKDPKVREEKRQEIEAEKKEAEARMQQKKAPFRERIETARPNDRKLNEAFEAALRKFCRTPGGPFQGCVPAPGHANVDSGFVAWRWNDADGTQAAWAHLRLREKPEVPANASKVAGKHYVSSHINNSMWVWAGHFKICFVMSKKDWQGKEKMPGAIQQFIDLDGLATVKGE